MTNGSSPGDAWFAARLAESEKAVYAVSEYLKELGFVVYTKPPVKAVTYPERGHEDLDMEVTHPLYAPKKKRIEVKGLSREFTSHEDWPWARIIVDEVEKFDRKNPVPWRYFLVSKTLSHAFVVNVTATRSDWVVERKLDSEYQYEKNFYRVPISLLKLVRL